MHKNKINISVVVPTYLRPRSLEQTIKSLVELEFGPDEIIIMDQSPRDESDYFLNRRVSDLDSRIHYIHVSEPGLCRARNLGIKAAKGELIFFSDDDVIYFEDTFIELLKRMSEEDIAMVAAINVNSRNKRPSITSIFGYLFFKKSLLNRTSPHISKGVYGRYPYRCDEDIVTSWAMGFAFCVKKEMVHSFESSFDEKLRSYAYAEDLDFTLQYVKDSRAIGKTCIFSPRVRVKHMCSDEWRLPGVEALAMNLVHREYIRRKHNLGVKYLFGSLVANLGDSFFYFMKNKKTGYIYMCMMLKLFKFQFGFKPIDDVSRTVDYIASISRRKI